MAEKTFLNNTHSKANLLPLAILKKLFRETHFSTENPKF